MLSLEAPIEAQLALHLRASCAPLQLINPCIEAIDAINAFDDNRDIELDSFLVMTARDIINQYQLNQFTIEGALS